MKNKLFKTIITIALLSTPSIAHAKGEETQTKTYKNDNNNQFFLEISYFFLFFFDSLIL